MNKKAATAQNFPFDTRFTPPIERKCGLCPNPDGLAIPAIDPDIKDERVRQEMLDRARASLKIEKSQLESARTFKTTKLFKEHVLKHNLTKVEWKQALARE